MKRILARRELHNRNQAPHPANSHPAAWKYQEDTSKMKIILAEIELVGCILLTDHDRILRLPGRRGVVRTGVVFILILALAVLLVAQTSNTERAVQLATGDPVGSALGFLKRPLRLIPL
jgi:hypothetical protein